MLEGSDLVTDVIQYGEKKSPNLFIFLEEVDTAGLK